MNILEKEIEDIICHCLDINASLLWNRGLFLRRNYVRQANLGSYGIADIITYEYNYNTVFIQIIELKKDLIDCSTLLQAIGYVKGVQRILEKDFNIQKNVRFEIILIGKNIQLNGNFPFYPDIFSNLKLYTYEIDLVDGVIFKVHEEYYNANEMRGSFKKEFNFSLRRKLISQHKDSLNSDPF